MPEGPEIFLASIFINAVSRNRVYGGRVVKSEVSTKNPDVDWDSDVYHISAVARGKELKLTLSEGDEHIKNGRTLYIIFRFGMSGSFKFTSSSEIPKHAHLRFFTTKEVDPMVLSFVDSRRFGHWDIGADWSLDRGSDPMWEYEIFRKTILSNLQDKAFNKPICEILLNQKYFNGIGNYLRAEILYRCSVCPFDEAREVLSELKPHSQWYDAKVKQMEKSMVKVENGVLQEGPYEVDVQPDLLDLCHSIPKEVIHLEGGGKGYNVDPEADEKEYAAFREWLQCYNQEGMNKLVDHNKRTIWFLGDPGKLVPKDPSRCSIVKRKQDVQESDQTTHSTAPKKNNVTKTKKKVLEKENQKEISPTAESLETKSKYFKSRTSVKTIEKTNKLSVIKVSKKSKTKTVSETPLRRSSRKLSSQSN